MHLFTTCILLVFLSAEFVVASFILAPTRGESQSPQHKAFPMTFKKKENRRHLDTNKAGSLLVPSQVLLAHSRCSVKAETSASTTLSRNMPSKPKKQSDSSFSRTALWLVPSQVMQHHSPNLKNLTPDNSNDCSSGYTKRKPTRRKLSNRNSSNISASPIGKQNGRNKSQERRKRSWQGDLPDVEWYV